MLWKYLLEVLQISWENSSFWFWYLPYIYLSLRSFVSQKMQNFYCNSLNRVIFKNKTIAWFKISLEITTCLSFSKQNCAQIVKQIWTIIWHLYYLSERTWRLLDEISFFIQWVFFDKWIGSFLISVSALFI